MILKQTLSRARCAAFARLLIAALCAGFAFTACDSNRGIQIAQEMDEPHFRRGQQLERSGRNQEALEAFMKVIDKRGSDPGAPESHLEAGQIYLKHIKDPYAAIYHFKRYLEYRPNSAYAAQVRQLIETAQKEIVRGLPGDPFGAQSERGDLLQAMDRLKKENDELKAQLARVGQTPAGGAAVAQNQPRPNSAPTRPATAPDNDYPAAGEGVSQPLPADLGTFAPAVPVESTTQAPATAARPSASGARSQLPPSRPAAGGRTYTTERGDTLYKISVRFYGTGSKWPAILEANRDQLRSERDVKAGMVLKIP